jgi:hypothetical protein
LTIAVIVAGCGSGDSQSAPLTKSAFVEQANGICKNATEERQQGTKEAVAKAAEADESDEAQVFTETLLAPVETMTEELGDLGPPKQQEKQVEAIIAAFEGGAEELEADPGFTKGSTAFSEANELAARYGLTECTI